MQELSLKVGVDVTSDVSVILVEYGVQQSIMNCCTSHLAAVTALPCS